jgi:dienelactone hydrolase
LSRFASAAGLAAGLGAALLVLAATDAATTPPADPGRLPQTRAHPSVRTAAFRQRMADRRRATPVRVLRLVDPTRHVLLPDGSIQPRTLVTYVRYPSVGSGPFPLVVFAHGYAVTPVPYRPLMQAWVRAGYVVAAPVFPLENANAPGGPDESDLVNQPGDVSFVLTRILALLGPLVDPARVAVAGHSDGAETALAVAYDGRFRDDRIRAAIILSGARLPGPLRFPRNSPPLLAAQGSADRINPPSFTRAFYDLAPRPKFLLTLPNAGHIAPYTRDSAQFRAVVRVTTAFLDHYLRGGPLARLLGAGRPGVATLDPSP